MSQLPTLHTVAEVAAALGESERYVKEKVRTREWPCRRGSRGAVSFTAEDVAEILRLTHQPAAAPESRRLALAPRSRRAS